MELLNDPDKVVQDGYVAFASSLFFYMTPQSPKPSMHEVATCYFEPNQADINVGIEKYNGLNGFGITTNIINGGYECGKGSETIGSRKRADYYKAWSLHFDLPTEDESSLKCGGMQKFKSNSAGAVNGYFDEGWGGKKCRIVNW